MCFLPSPPPICGKFRSTVCVSACVSVTRVGMNVLRCGYIHRARCADKWKMKSASSSQPVHNSLLGGESSMQHSCLPLGTSHKEKSLKRFNPNPMG